MLQSYRNCISIVYYTTQLDLSSLTNNSCSSATIEQILLTSMHYMHRQGYSSLSVCLLVQLIILVTVVCYQYMFYEKNSLTASI